MVKKDFQFFLGWSIATFVATTLYNVVMTIMDKVNFGFHIVIGIICICSAVAIVGLVLYYFIKQKKGATTWRMKITANIKTQKEK